MATTTDHLGLAKCELTDNISPDWINQNFESLDDIINDLQNAYITSYGTSDDWTWRVWSNGIAESWITIDRKFTFKRWGTSPVGYSNFSLNLPTIYKTKPSVQITCEGYGTLIYAGIWSSNETTDISSITPYLASSTNTSGQYRARVYIRVIGERS